MMSHISGTNKFTGYWRGPLRTFMLCNIKEKMISHYNLKIVYLPLCLGCQLLGSLWLLFSISLILTLYMNTSCVPGTVLCAVKTEYSESPDSSERACVNIII